ncbi:RloB family protein [Vibrio fluvialis]|nr:RloB family protein [Vibrio fluvialis]MBY8208078.1 RloB family protein [Vibrio fluvialis]
MRETRSGSRYSKKINPIHVYVAYEGDETEDGYFKAVRDLISRRFEKNIKFFPVEKTSTQSQPEKVFNDLDAFLKKNNVKIDNKDHFGFLVIDKDDHFEGTKAAASYEAVRDCRLKNISVLCTTPCFELWLILHYIDISQQSEEDRQKLLANRKVSKNNRYIKVHYNGTIKNGESYEQTVRRISIALENETRLNSLVKDPNLIPPPELQSNVGQIFLLLKQNGIEL